ncbi:ECF transporter S component, partial [Streptococcus parasanguinis]
SVYALIYHIPWWTYVLVNGFSFNLAHALSTIIFYPIIYQIFRRFYVEKNHF